jgi:glycerol dehydrogenase
MMRSFVSPPRYIQTAGALEQLGSNVDRHGTDALLVTDEVVHDVIIDTVEKTFSRTRAEYRVALFDGECTERELTRLSEIAREWKSDVIVGAGGGKAIDVAKGVRGRTGGALVSLPTIASTDAPTSGISVVYSDDGRVVGGIVHDRHPDVVLVDTEIVATAPTRWFVSGIGDALATRFEAAATVESSGRTVTGGSPTRAGVALAEECYDVLRTHALAAVHAVDDGVVTEAVEETTEAIILLSGLGFENGGLAAAHAIHDGIAATVETGATHGEKVCLGLLAQLVLEERSDEEIRDVARFASELGLPVTLDAIAISPSHVEAIAEAARDDNTTIGNQPGDPTSADIERALLAADEFGHSLK